MSTHSDNPIRGWATFVAAILGAFALTWYWLGETRSKSNHPPDPNLVASTSADPLDPTADRATPATHEPVDFVRDVRPILRARCHSCHGREIHEANLRLDEREHALRGGDSGAVIIPTLTDSRLLQRIASPDEDFVMPPEGARLSNEEIAILRRWIETGADWPTDASSQQHWAYTRLERPTPSATGNAGWLRNPIDGFTLVRLESESIEPSPEADRVTLCRRLHFDLIGLPPRIAEVSAFVNDERPDAYERLVDRLLASPHYGEKWAAHWLDQARYADSDGFEVDHERPYAWRYRHWVIESLNADMPFDEFTHAQLAGDLLQNATLDQRIAVGFHRNSPISREAGVKPDQSRFDHNIDRTNTIGTVWLAHSVGCAQCHDHKFDDFTQREYYQLFGFSNSTTDIDIDAPLNGEPDMASINAEREQRIGELLSEFDVPRLMSAWEDRLRYTHKHPGENYLWDRHLILLDTYISNGSEILLTAPADRMRQQRRALRFFFLDQYKRIVSDPEWAKLNFVLLKAKLAEIDRELPAVSSAQSIQQRSPAKATHIHNRGDYFQPGETVSPGLPAFLYGSVAPRESHAADLTRLDLARWLTSPENPLTPRVIANRQWQEFFGRGIVKTSEDFGVRGDRPTHPQLLDWLGAKLRDSGWSLKKVHRLIVTSSTYRQSSRHRPELDVRDGDNALLARQKRSRLPAELIRDVALSVSETRVDRIGGPSVKPPQPRGFANLAEAGEARWQPTTGPNKYRRGVYIHIQRTVLYPQLTNFDAADSTVTSCRRETSNTPMQALNLLNDTVFFEAAVALGGQLANEATSRSLEHRLGWAFRRCMSRAPTSQELTYMKGFFEHQQAILKQTPKHLKDLTTDLEEQGFAIADRIDAACWVCTARLLMNLDEFYTRE